jgi:hypothetical protein
MQTPPLSNNVFIEYTMITISSLSILYRTQVHKLPVPLTLSKTRTKLIEVSKGEAA